MANTKRTALAAGMLGVLGLAWLAGCSSTPSRVEMVDIDPDDAAAQAMSQYDANQDGKLADDELRAVPGILKWKLLYDSDGDGAVSEEEIVARLEKWQSDQLGFRAISANVTMNGRPVSGVRISLIPETYLGVAIKPAFGLTNGNGYAVLTVAPEDLPDAIKERGIRFNGVYPGTYKIAIQGDKGKLPDTTRDNLPLGDEIARDTVNSSISIALSSR